jgi:hypothetical protein
VAAIVIPSFTNLVLQGIIDTDSDFTVELANSRLSVFTFVEESENEVPCAERLPR